jgi:type IV secretory pathway VirB2 component (pilin)
MSNSRLTAVRNRVASLTRLACQEVPVPAALAGLSFTALERLGERACSSRKRRLSLLSLAAMMVLVGPAAAQAGCSGGPLTFLSSVHSMIQRSAGLIIVSMVIAAGIMKMIPGRGTNSIGNALIGGVLVGLVFLVVGPALVELAGQNSPINPNACGAGGGSGG